MEHKPFIVFFINRILVSFARKIGLHCSSLLIPTHIIMAGIVTFIVIGFFYFCVKKPSIFPGKKQFLLEKIFLFFRNILDDLIGPEGRKFTPVIGTLGIFIASSNLLGLLPEMSSPTSNINVTAGCAIFIFLYYHYQGIKKHGFFGYIRTFMGPAWWLAWLMFPIEVVSHFSRVLSLTVRLFGNIFGEDLVIVVVASIVPFVAPLPMMAMAIFTSVLQAFVFITLSTVYLAGATISEH